MKKHKVATSGPRSLAKAIGKAGAGRTPARSIEYRDDGSLTLNYSTPKMVFTLGGVEPDAVAYVESHFLDENERAWLRIVDAMDLALLNPGITNNIHAAEFCSLVRELAVCARGHSTIDQVLAPLKTAAKSMHASDVASKKNAEPRAWVLNEWNGRTDHGQSKASFARQHASLVKSKFNLDVTPETIGAWLPKG